MAAAVTASAWLRAYESRHGFPTYQPARVAADSQLLTPQLIPRRIVMTAPNASSAYDEHGRTIRTWWKHNPEYSVTLLDEAACSDFVSRFCSEEEQQAYAACLVGSQRADLFRVYFLRLLGGIYVDTDLELHKPLRTLIPHNASVVASERWEIEFMAYTPGHPLLHAVARGLTSNVNRQVTMWRQGDKARCKGAHNCIIWTTGPHAHRAVILETVKAAGCHVQRWIPARATVTPPSKQCRDASVPEIRTIHVCRDTRGSGGMWLGWMYCGVMRHWDCRNSKGPGKSHCSKTHYSVGATRNFFRLGNGLEGGGAT